MFESIRNALSFGPDSMMVSTVSDPGFVVSSTLTLKENGIKKDHSHLWTIEFAKPVRDGNQVSQLNFREDGQVIGQLALHSGDEMITLEMNPTEYEIEVLAVTTEGEVRDTSRVEFHKERVTG